MGSFLIQINGIRRWRCIFQHHSTHELQRMSNASESGREEEATAQFMPRIANASTMASVMGDGAQSPPSSSFHQAIATNSPAISTTTTTSSSSSSSLATPELKSPLTRFELMGPSVASSSESPESPPSPSLLRDRDSNRVWAAKRIAEMSPESLQLLSPQRPPTSPSSPPSPYSPPSPSVAGGMQSSETPRNQVICVGGGSSVVSAHTHYSTSEVTNNCAASASKDVLEFASATGLNLDGFDSTTFCVLDCYLETAKVSGNSHEWVLRELEVFLLSKKQSNNIIDKVQEAKDDIIDHQKEMIGDVLAKLNNLTHQVQRMERQQLRNNKKSSETLGTIAEGVAFTQDTMNQIIGTDTGDSLEGNDGGEKADASTGAEIEEYVEAKPPAREVLSMPYDNTAVGENAGFSSSALPPRPMSGPPRTVIATAVGGGGAIEDCDEMTIASTGGRSICSTSSGRKYKSLYPPGQTPMQALASKLTEGLKSVSMQETTTLENEGDATCTTPVWLDPSIASDIDGVLPSDPTSPPTTDPIVEPLADAGTDNPIRPASNANAGSIDDTKAVAGAETAPAHGVTIAPTDGMVMAPIPNAPGQVSKDAARILPDSTPIASAPCKTSGANAAIGMSLNHKGDGAIPFERSSNVGRDAGRHQDKENADAPARPISGMTEPRSMPGNSTSPKPATLLSSRAGGPSKTATATSTSRLNRSKTMTRSRKSTVGTSHPRTFRPLPSNLQPRSTNVLSTNGICSVEGKPERTAKTSVESAIPIPSASSESKILVLSKAEGAQLMKQLNTAKKRIEDLDGLRNNKLYIDWDAEARAKISDSLNSNAFLHTPSLNLVVKLFTNIISDAQLNNSRTAICRQWLDVIRDDFAGAIERISKDEDGDELRKKLAAPLRQVAAHLCKTLGRGEPCVVDKARAVYRRILLLTSDPTFYAPLKILGDLVPTKSATLAKSCGMLLSFAIDVASPKSIELCESSKKKPTFAISSPIAALSDSNAGHADVRLHGRIAYFRLKAKGYKEIEERVQENLDRTDRNNLIKSEAHAIEKWSKGEKAWLIKYGRL